MVLQGTTGGAGCGSRPAIGGTKAVVEQGNQPVGEIQIHALQAAQGVGQGLEARATGGLVWHLAQVWLEALQPVGQ